MRQENTRAIIATRTVCLYTTSRGRREAAATIVRQVPASADREYPVA